MNIKKLVVGGTVLLSLSALVATGPAAFAQDAAGGGAAGAAGQGAAGRKQGKRARGAQQQRRPAMANPRQVAAAFDATTPSADAKDKFQVLQTKLRADMKALRPTDGTRPGPEVMAKNRELSKKFIEDAKALLTPEQQKKFDEEIAKVTAQGQGGGMNLLNMLDAQLMLTPEAKTKIEPIAKETQAKLQEVMRDRTMEQPAKREKAMTLLTNFKAQVRPLLTPEQQSKLDTMRMPMGGGGAGRGGRRGGAGAGAPGGAAPGGI